MKKRKIHINKNKISSKALCNLAKRLIEDYNIIKEIEEA